MPLPKLILAGLAVAALGYFAWPTPWRSVMISGNTARVSRLNGCVQVLTGDGWRPVGERKACMSHEKRSAEEMRAEVTGLQDEYAILRNPMIDAALAGSSLRPNDEGQAVLSIKNTTSCVIESVELLINSQPVVDYYDDYSELVNRPIRPGETGERTFDISQLPPLGSNYEWGVVGLEYGSPVGSGSDEFIHGHPQCARNMN